MEGNGASTAQGDLGMESTDWRSELSAASRQIIVDQIIETLRKHLPMSASEVDRIAVRFEQKLYAIATSQADYLRKIYLKVLTMDSKYYNTNPLASNSHAGIQNSQDPVAVQQPKNLKCSCSHVMGKEKKCPVEEEILWAICLDPVMDNGDRSTAKL